MNHLRRALGGTRTRILAAFVVLMVFSTAVSVIAIYEVLTVRADDRLDAALDQEIDEFRRLAAGIDPEYDAAVRRERRPDLRGLQVAQRARAR